MAATAATVAGTKRQYVGQLISVVRRITLDNAYVTGGEPVTAAQLGLHRVRRIVNVVLEAGIAVAAHVDPLIQTDGSVKIRLRTAAGAEVASLADASTVVISLTVEGY